MKPVIGFAIGLICLAIGSTAAQERVIPLPQEHLVGVWVPLPLEKGTGTEKFLDALLAMKRLEIQKKDDSWFVEMWQKSSFKAEGRSLGKVKLFLLGNNPKAKELPNGFATWEVKDGGIVYHLTLRFEKDELVAERFTIFKDGAPRKRSNYYTITKLKKQ